MDRYDSFGNLIKERKEMRDFKLVTPDLVKAEFDWKMATYVIMDHPLSNAVIAVIGDDGDIKAPTKQAWSYMNQQGDEILEPFENLSVTNSEQVIL